MMNYIISSHQKIKMRNKTCRISSMGCISDSYFIIMFRQIIACSSLYTHSRTPYQLLLYSAIVHVLAMYYSLSYIDGKSALAAATYIDAGQRP